MKLQFIVSSSSFLTKRHNGLIEQITKLFQREFRCSEAKNTKLYKNLNERHFAETGTVSVLSKFLFSRKSQKCGHYQPWVSFIGSRSSLDFISSSSSSWGWRLHLNFTWPVLCPLFFMLFNPIADINYISHLIISNLFVVMTKAKTALTALGFLCVIYY